MELIDETAAAALAPDAATVDEARAFNARLARLPRFRVRNRVMPMLLQGLLRLSQLGADGRLARRGIALERPRACADGNAGPAGVPVRILRPPGPVRAVVLDIHGGGWVIGNARMDDERNAALALACGALVVAVDYRLATRATVHAQMDECLAAARWVLDGGPAGSAGLPLFVTGESAGGHLAAATLLRLKAGPALAAMRTGTTGFAA